MQAKRVKNVGILSYKCTISIRMKNYKTVQNCGKFRYACEACCKLTSIEQIAKTSLLRLIYSNNNIPLFPLLLFSPSSSLSSSFFTREARAPNAHPLYPRICMKPFVFNHVNSQCPSREIARIIHHLFSFIHYTKTTIGLIFLQK